MSEEILRVSDDDFAETVTNSDVPVLVDYWAEWCGPCHVVAPVVETIASEQAGRLRVAKLNVDENPRTAQEYGVLSIPTLILFGGGKELGRVWGRRARTPSRARSFATLPRNRPACRSGEGGAMPAPIFELIQEEDASPEVRQTYQDIKARYGGRLPDIYKAFAHDPEYLASINEHMKRVLQPRKVDSRTKEVIAFVVAATSGCDYCAHAHAAGLRRHGYDDEAIAEVLATAALWSEITRFNIGAGVTWPERNLSSVARQKATGTEG